MDLGIITDLDRLGSTLDRPCHFIMACQEEVMSEISKWMVTIGIMLLFDGLVLMLFDL